MIKSIYYGEIKPVYSKIKSITKQLFGIKLKPPLAKDTVELSAATQSPEILPNNPMIIIGKFNSGINDSRFESFWTEYRAYDFQGYDNHFPNNYLCIDSMGDKRLKPHIYLNMVEVKPEFARQGVYSEAIRKLIEVSKKEGCEGRIILDSMKIESPTMTKIPSPSLAHWKNGFRFANPENNKIMERVLKGELPLEDAPSGTMYLPVI